MGITFGTVALGLQAAALVVKVAEKVVEEVDCDSVNLFNSNGKGIVEDLIEKVFD